MTMITRFCLYSVFKNLRFADPFLVLFLIHVNLSFTEAGVLLGLQHLMSVSMEIPSGMLADRWGRRKALVGCFFAYAACYAGLGFSPFVSGPLFFWWIALSLGCFGIGEALRTGSHKAIMLDFLDVTGQPDRATEVLGQTRSWSKFSAGASAIAGGLILFAFQQYEPLFWLSCVPALAGAVLMLSYPRYLDGNHSRSTGTKDSQTVGMMAGLRGMFRDRRTVALMCQSIVFESQIKVILKYYSQPILQSGLARHGILLTDASSSSLLGRSGAVWIGGLEFLRETTGGVASRISRRFEYLTGSRRRAIGLCYIAATATGFLIAATVLGGMQTALIPAVICFFLLTAIQNLRRPVFVSSLDESMEKSLRATVLSIESVARAASVAATLPAMGYLADIYGPEIALILPSALLLSGLAIPQSRRQEEPRRTPAIALPPQ